MDEEQFSNPKGSYSTATGFLTEKAGTPGETGDSAFSSTVANMDRYDYMNMLAESRIVDIAWIR